MSKHLAVDTHFHLFDAHRAIAGARYVPAYDAPYSAWSAQASSAGVQRGVLVQPSFLGTDNSRLLQELQAHGSRLRGVAVVAPDVGPEQIAGLHQHGVRGIRLNLAGRLSEMETWRRASRLWDIIGAMQWHVELHTDRGDLPSALMHVPAQLPVVIDHMGKPGSIGTADPTVVAVRQRALRSRVWVKLSGPYRLGGQDPRALARLWQTELGTSQLLWGSDWPFTNHEHEVDYAALASALRDWVDEAARARILVDNPNAVYWAD